MNEVSHIDSPAIYGSSLDVLENKENELQQSDSSALAPRVWLLIIICTNSRSMVIDEHTTNKVVVMKVGVLWGHQDIILEEFIGTQSCSHIG